jgi:PPM family protein phosphatase
VNRKCPRCGHDNVGRALFCYQCGRDLNAAGIVEGSRGTGRLVSDALRFMQERGASMKDVHSKTAPSGVEGQPLTCLNCGALNRPDATRCVQCDHHLLVPDEDFNLLLRSSARTSVGEVRSNNEDNLSIWATDGVLIALVADGMGGAAAGEEASRLAVEAVQADFMTTTRGSDQLLVLSEMELGKRLVEAVKDANRAVIEKAQTDFSYKGMGTTSTLVMVRANRAIIAHVGDSRCYHVDSLGKITQVTVDHSFVQALVASGHITEDQARTHPMGNVLYRALGQSVDLDVDVYTRFLHAGDRLVICSDGLTRHLLPEDIGKIVHNEANPHDATLRLIELANKRGGEDNISVIVIKLVQAGTEDTVPMRPVGR